MPTTTAETFAPNLSKGSRKSIGDDLHIAMNPEFLREGSVVDDFQNPDKVVFGTQPNDEVALDALHEVFDRSSIP